MLAWSFSEEAAVETYIVQLRNIWNVAACDIRKVNCDCGLSLALRSGPAR